MSRARVEDLHEQAAGHYLQGDFRSAAETWHRILADAPHDERALEGVRLCTGLEGGVDPAARRVPKAGVRVAASLLDSIDELEREQTSATAAAGPQGAGGGAAGFLDLSELAGEGLPVSPADFSGSIMTSPADTGDVEPKSADADVYATGMELPESGGPAHEFDFGDWPDDEEVTVVSSEDVDPDGDPDEEPEAEHDAPPATSSTAAELRHRVRELMEVALAAVERGDKDDAMAVLARLQILDEENEAVRSLQEKIRLEIESERGMRGEANAGTAAPCEPPPPLEILDIGTDDPVGPAVASGPAAGEVRGREVVAVAGPAPPRAAARRSEISARLREIAASWPSVPRPVLWVAAACVLLLGVTLVGWRVLGGEDTAEVARDSAAATPAVETPREPAAGGPPDRPAAAPGAKPAGAEPLVPDDRPVRVVVAELLARADELFESDDYRAAVVAYNEVLALDPDHTRARERLLVAGNRYKDRRAEEEEWANAVRAFEIGEYQQALHAFYRVPEDRRPKGLERYKLNGWYNLGLVALEAGDCREALTNLYEAQAISANDAGTITAIELARLCRGGERATPSYQLAVGMLELRGLND